jgi:hypothetical protein
VKALSKTPAEAERISKLEADVKLEKNEASRKAK